ncbi:MAG: CHASE2 domain-containing protein, partial [Acidobacteriota bacterium]
AAATPVQVADLLAATPVQAADLPAATPVQVADLHPDPDRLLRPMKRFFLPLVVFGLAAGLYSAGVLVPLENGLAAINFKLNRRTASRDLVVVAIDPTSLDRLPIWPWPRSYHAAVIENLLAAGARRVGLDIDFSSRSSLEEDQVLENTVEKVGQKVILPAFLQWEEQPDGPALLRESLPLPSLRAPATLASINVQPDPDGLVRWYGSPQGESASRFPSLAAVLEGADGNRSRSFQVDFSIDPGSVPRLSYVDVLTGQFDTDLVRDRNVIIGATSLELGDQVTVPVHATIAGILLQALAFESLHQGRALHGAGAPGELGLALLMALAAGPLMVRFSWRKSLALLSLLGGSSLALELLILATNAVLLDTSPALLTACGCFAGGLLHRVDQQKLRLLIQERLLQRKSILMHHVMENSLDAILTLKEDSSIETCNQAAERMLGAPAGAIRGQPLSRFARMAGNGVTEGDTASSGRRGLHDGPLTKRPGEGLGFRWDGTSFPMEMVSSTFQVEDRVVRVVLLRDMTELRRQQEILQHQATHDDLTDLPNRVMLKDRLQEILAKAEEGGNSVAFLLLDLDQFKEVNDTLGHHVGDLLLRQVAARLRGLLKPPALMARLGGDEFGVLLPEADLESARNQAQAFLGALAQPFIVAQHRQRHVP